MTTLEIIMTSLTAILGSANIWQFFTVRSLRRMRESEADQAQVKTLGQIIEMYSQELATLQARYDKLVDKYDNLVVKYDSLQSEFLNLKNLIGGKA